MKKLRQECGEIPKVAQLTAIDPSILMPQGWGWGWQG